MYSPDTDVLYIALMMVNPIVEDVCIQTNRLGQPRMYISITKLVDALKQDPDLVGIPEEERTKILVSLYALLGCDYTSLFVGHGKVSIMKVFFERAQFICEDSAEKPGSIAKLNEGTGFYAFLRLIGAVYFHAHRPGFPEHTTLESLYNSLQHSDRIAEEVHTEFIETIRTAYGNELYLKTISYPQLMHSKGIIYVPRGRQSIESNQLKTTPTCHLS